MTHKFYDVIIRGTDCERTIVTYAESPEGALREALAPVNWRPYRGFIDCPHCGKGNSVGYMDGTKREICFYCKGLLP